MVFVMFYEDSPVGLEPEGIMVISLDAPFDGDEFGGNAVFLKFGHAIASAGIISDARNERSAQTEPRSRNGGIGGITDAFYFNHFVERNFIGEGKTQFAVFFFRISADGVDGTAFVAGCQMYESVNRNVSDGQKVQLSLRFLLFFAKHVTIVA